MRITVLSFAVAAAMLAGVSAVPARPNVAVKAVRSSYGTILADGRGQAVYVFGRERRGRSECYGACAKAWPPLIAKGRLAAGRGARRRLLGTTRRRDGRRQLTYRGRPLYYYVGDSPGRVLCQNVREFGGLWVVGRPDGTPVT
jgi:predicted lipoprotein with Yx(FWY)xxD motif